MEQAIYIDVPMSRMSRALCLGRHRSRHANRTARVAGGRDYEVRYTAKNSKRLAASLKKEEGRKQPKACREDT
jgi:hypothetical protein